MDNNFDPILYSIGDKVIAKNKSPDIDGNIPKEEEVVSVENIEFSAGKICQLLYFKSNPSSFELAINFEPSDPVAKEKYWEIVRQSGFTVTKGRAKSTPKVKKLSTKELKIKNFLKDN